ncbi:MAG TPA: 3-dehydroquinate synthase [Chroococcales cyanobacterium]
MKKDLSFPFIALAGFMGTGKSTVGKVLAEKLEWPFFDSDQRVEESAGKPVSRIFAEDGEAHFRQLEREVLAELSRKREVVIATGGGSLLCEENRKELSRGLLFVLDASLPAIAGRIGNEGDRPLFSRLEQLYAERKKLYLGFPFHLETVGRTPDEIAEALLELISSKKKTLSVSLGERSYPILLEAGGIAGSGAFLSERAMSGRCLLVSDENVFPLYGSSVLQSLGDAGFSVQVAMVPAGEKSKSLEKAADLFRQLIENRSDRRSPVIALGGGVIGDLAGFVASTYQRGVPFFQIPTSLLAQIDSSVGGKVAVNHPLAKNMIGTFHQPQGVLIDPLCLLSLPEREYRSGLAELVKYGVILDEQLFASIERDLPSLLARKTKVLIPLIARACELKAAVVEKDERENDLRAILNFGHTLGHAVEAIAGYCTFTHGEAVAMGMVKAGELALLSGFPTQDQKRLKNLLEAIGLPTRVPDLSASALLEAMTMDKKNQGNSISMVLPIRLGRADLPRMIDPETLRSFLKKN